MGLQEINSTITTNLPPEERCALQETVIANQVATISQLKGELFQLLGDYRECKQTLNTLISNASLLEQRVNALEGSHERLAQRLGLVEKTTSKAPATTGNPVAATSAATNNSLIGQQLAEIKTANTKLDSRLPAMETGSATAFAKMPFNAVFFDSYKLDSLDMKEGLSYYVKVAAEGLYNQKATREEVVKKLTNLLSNWLIFKGFTPNQLAELIVNFVENMVAYTQFANQLTKWGIRCREASALHLWQALNASKLISCF